jgi:hypothetical protein
MGNFSRSSALAVMVTTLLVAINLLTRFVLKSEAGL